MVHKFHAWFKKKNNLLITKYFQQNKNFLENIGIYPFKKAKD